MRSKRKTTESYILEATEKHKGFYSYEKVIYQGCEILIIITCPIHGDFLQKPFQHLSKNGCQQCAKLKTNVSNTPAFIQKATQKHNDYYSYEKVNYTGAKDFVTITCPVHGDFKQRPNYHLSGNGCTSCYKENNGFGKTKFLHSCRKSGKGSLYVIKCFSEKEEFIKIGITSKSVYERFKRKKRFPYSYELIKQIEGTAEEIYNLEKTLHRNFREYKYTPKVDFKGSTECFNLLILNYDFTANAISS